MTYKQIITVLNDFCDAHYMVQKFDSDFLEQLPNLATKDEKYPLVFVSPVSSTQGLDLNYISVEIRCLDIIQKDRANITTILSDTQQILNDIYLFVKEGDNLEIDTTTIPSLSPLNNDILDYAAGWVMQFEFEVSGFNVCDIPKD